MHFLGAGVQCSRHIKTTYNDCYSNAASACTCTAQYYHPKYIYSYCRPPPYYPNDFFSPYCHCDYVLACIHFTLRHVLPQSSVVAFRKIITSCIHMICLYDIHIDIRFAFLLLHTSSRKAAPMASSSNIGARPRRVAFFSTHGARTAFSNTTHTLTCM